MPDSPSPGVGAHRPVIHRYGRSALLIEVAADRIADWVAAIGSMPSAESITELVPAANTVLVVASPDDLPAIRRSLANLDPQIADTPALDVVELEVHYDGDDLDDVADASRLSVEEVIRRHAAKTYRVQFCGFAPGFAYLSGLDPLLQLARRATPRPSVPAGSLAIAGPYAAVYPTPSPGGWHLLGHYDQQRHGPLFDAGRFDRDGDDPTFLVPGRPVRFRQAERPRLSVSGSRSEISDETGSIDIDRRPAAGDRGTVATLRILDPGFATTLQDGGRAGVARFAVSPSGAADPSAYELGQRIVGNRATDHRLPPSLEVVLGGLSFETDAATVIAITGAPVEVAIEHDGRRSTASTGHAIHLAPGSVVQLGRASVGLRTYVAVRGVLDLSSVLGSRVLGSRVLGSHSFDSLGRLGPRPLAPGDLLGFRQPSGSFDLPAPDAVPNHPIDDSPTIEISPGPRLDWITDASADLLIRQTFTVSDQADRIGVRFDGVQPLERRPNQGELPSEGLLIGAMQIPPDGRPIIFGPDHPTTGGYPVVAVAEPSTRSTLAQLRPGQHVRFRWSRQ